MERLPDDIVAEILSRVPVKTLVQIRYVCKSWYAIISNRKFSKLQLEQSNKNKNADTHKLLIISKLSPQLTLLDYEHDDYCVSKGDYPLERNKDYFLSVGSCNGLFCLEVRDKIVIWNPSINQYKIVPKPSYSRRPKVVYGFGYDSLSDDYKVVRIVCASLKIIVDIYNLKTNSWRGIDDPSYNASYCIFSSRSGWKNNILNGSLHWLTRGEFDDTMFYKLVAFSLEEEKFLEVPMPDVDDINKFRSMCVFEGCLCVSRMDHGDSGVELWVMKEYMVRASWTKLCTVLWESIPKFHIHTAFLPLFSSRINGDILLSINVHGVLVKYNMKEKMGTKSTDIQLKPAGDHREYVAHVESLVSPNFDKRCHTSRLIKCSTSKRRI